MRLCILAKVIVIVLFAQILFAQTDNIGSGRALKFDGLDDFISLGNVYDDLSLPITVSAWINIDPSVSTWAPVFVSQDNSSIYNGFWLIVQPTRISIGYGDGQGENSLAYRRSKIAEVSNIAGRWVHLCAIIRSALDMDLIVNGINVGGAYSGFTNLPMSSSSVDVAKIGYWFSNSEIFRFKGQIDEVRLWNRSLSQSEIRNEMCKQIPGTSNGLIGLWNFNETDNQVLDQSTNSFNGVLQGSPLRQFSGAPIGNESQINYTSSWASQNFNFSSSPTINISNITGAPEGIHIYKVHFPPSIQTGLTSQAETSGYYGVFLASLDNNNRYNFEILDEEKSFCNVFTRQENNSTSWSIVDVPQLQVLQRSEYLVAEGLEIPFELGERIAICEGVTQNIDTGLTDTDFTFLWNTGETTRNILVNNAGVYSVEVTSPCGSSFDQVEVFVELPPSVFSLGTDEVLCTLSPIVLKPYLENENYEFKWNDGSTDNHLEVTDFGSYWVEVKNACGVAKDTIIYSKLDYKFENIPNVITPNGDGDNEFFVISDELPYQSTLLIVDRWGLHVYESSDYKNDWNAQNLSTGVYFYRLSGSCLKETKGIISVIR